MSPRTDPDRRLPPSRRALRAWLLLPALVSILAACSRREPRPFNVLLVTLDTTRADFLGTYGRAGNPTPVLDALARDGTRFDLALATAAVTPVSHASILSGLDNQSHGLRVLAAGSGFRLPPDVPTLATVLQARGYRTAAIHSAFPVSAHFGFANGFDTFESFESSARNEQGSWDVLSLQRRSDATTDLALAATRTGDRPFFLWLHYWDPHDPALLPPQEFLPADLPRDAAGRLVQSRELYGAEVSYLDQQFGRLIDALKSSGEYERTLIVVVADHGEGLGDHGWEHHRILYQEQIRVPLIVRVPGVRHEPSVASLVSTVDIAPTVLDYLGAPPLARCDGTSLRPEIEGGTPRARIALADQINGYDKNAGMVRKRPLDDFLYGASDGRWKLVYRPTNPGESELFDLRDDPRELANRYASEPAERERLLVALAERAPWVTSPFPDLGDEEASRRAGSALDGLGYTGDDEPEDGDPASASGDPAWSWICPRHPDEIGAAGRRCPSCGAPPVPVRRPARGPSPTQESSR